MNEVHMICALNTKQLCSQNTPQCFTCPVGGYFVSKGDQEPNSHSNRTSEVFCKDGRGPKQDHLSIAVPDRPLGVCQMELKGI